MKIGFLITARLKSSRLPLKLLRDLNGKTVIERTIERIKEIKGIDGIVLCTSTNPQDKPLIDIAKSNDIYYFTGVEEDVFSRLYTCARLFGFDYILNTAGDNPLMSIYYANKTVDAIKKEELDFIKTDGLPLGTAVYGLNVNTMGNICKIKDRKETEFWTHLINNEEIFKVKILKTKLPYHDLFRLTMDYEEDYRVMSILFSRIQYNRILSLHRVLEYIEENIWIHDINRNCKSMELTKKEVDDIKENIIDNF